MCGGRGWRGRVRRDGTAADADAVDWDGLFTEVGCTSMDMGRSVAVMANGGFLKQVIWRILERRGKALSSSEPIPQNLTANTDNAPNPETAPKFFTHPPILATKSMFGASP